MQMVVQGVEALYVKLQFNRYKKILCGHSNVKQL